MATTVLLTKIKSRVVAPSFYIKMMKRCTFQTCSLKYSIQNGMFSALNKMNLFRSSRGKSPLEFLALRLPGRLVLVIFLGSLFSISFLLTLFKALLSLDDATLTSRAQSLCHFAQFRFIVSAILPSDLK